jgi:hypothetical protein
MHHFVFPTHRAVTIVVGHGTLIGTLIGALLGVLLFSGASATGAQDSKDGNKGGSSRLEAHYTASLAGIPVGKGTWTVEISGSRYSASASGGTVGLLKLFASGEGSGSVRGSFAGARPLMSAYTSSVKTERKTDAVRLLVTGGVVRDVSVSPPVDADPERVPVTDAHRRGIVDPMTASLIRVPGNAAPVGPDACRDVSVFDGRARYDMQLDYKRIEQVKTEHGYDGPVVVCAIYFKPIAGFVLSRTAVKYLMRQRDMEAWLAPLAGTRVVVPYRISVPTPIGLAVLQATDFVSGVRAAANGKGASPTQAQ